MKMEEIGFYTLSDERCRDVCETSRMMRGEMLLTHRCNFSCPYCRGLRGDLQGDMPLETAMRIMDIWAVDDLRAIRFSGGEPMVYPHLLDLVTYARLRRITHIAVSTNGSFPLGMYDLLINEGVNDFSISLDACCAAFGDRMSGTNGRWKTVVENIRRLSKRVYVTVGIVITEENLDQMLDTILFAHGLGVADIRIVSAAQDNRLLQGLKAIPQGVLDAHPILKYRVGHYLSGRNVRGIEDYDSRRCALVLDDSVVCQNKHYPCVIYLREGGKPIGEIEPDMKSGMREERAAWFREHDTHDDPICRRNCLDVCIDHNNCYQRFHKPSVGEGVRGAVHA